MKSPKSEPLMEKRIGGNAGAMKVEWEVCSTGEDSRDISDPEGSSTSTGSEPSSSFSAIVVADAGL